MNRPHILPFRLLLCLWLLCFALPSAAQRGLHVEPLFGSSYGKVATQDGVAKTK